MKLEVVLKEQGVGYERWSHRPTFTAQGLAEAEHVSGYKVAKPVIVRGGRGYAMCVIPACTRLNLRRVAEVLQEFNVRLATESEMAELFPECELGAEPPVGKIFGMKTIIDQRLHEDDYILMQAGSHTEALKMRRTDWERLCDPVVADITHT